MKKLVEKRQVAYRNLFMLGVIFTGAGVAIAMPPMMILGLVLLAIGLLNRDKWTSAHQ